MNKPVVERITLEQLQALQQESQSLIQPAIYPIDLLLTGKMGKLASDHQQQYLKSTQAELRRVLQLMMAERPSLPRANPK